MTRSKYVGVEITPMAQVRIVIAQMEGTGDEISKAVSGVLESFGARPVMQLPPAPAQEQPREEATVRTRRAMTNRGRAKQPATVVAQAAVTEPTSTGPSAHVKSSAGGGVDGDTHGPQEKPLSVALGKQSASSAVASSLKLPTPAEKAGKPVQFRPDRHPLHEPVVPPHPKGWNKTLSPKKETVEIPPYTAPAQPGLPAEQEPEDGMPRLVPASRIVLQALLMGPKDQNEIQWICQEELPEQKGNIPKAIGSLTRFKYVEWDGLVRKWKLTGRGVWVARRLEE